MKKPFLTAPTSLIAALVVLLLPGTASAVGPQIVDLTSPSHGDGGFTRYSNDPSFTWSAAPGTLTAYTAADGGVLSVALAGSYAYVASIGGLHVVDITTPTAPKEVGSLALLHGGGPVAVAGTHAYVGDAWGYLNVVDVSSPTAPSVVGSLRVEVAGDVRFVTVNGSYVYLTDYSGLLKIVDVHEPAAPSLVSSLFLDPYLVGGITVVGQYAYCGTWSGALFGALQIVDVTNPAAPSRVGEYELHDPLGEVAIGGDYAFCGSPEGFRVFDVSDPANPALIGSAALADAGAVALYGGNAYVLTNTYGSAFVRTVDISTPSAPSVVVGASAVSRDARNLEASSGYAYVPALDDGLQVVDLTPSTSFTYSFLIDQSPDTQADQAVDSVADLAHPSIAYADLSNGDWYFHVRARDGDGVWGPSATLHVNIDHTPVIDNLNSSTHPYWSAWYRGNDPRFTWATNPEAGLCTYSYTLDTDSSGVPDAVTESVSNPASPSVSYTDVADGTSYFHVRPCNIEGDWGATATFQVNIDTHKPKTRAPYAAVIARYGTAKLKYKILDSPPNGGTANVTIKIRNRAGTVVKSLGPYKGKAIGILWTAKFTCKLPKGKYRFSVYAKDTAGNGQALPVGSNTLTVR